MIYYFLLASLLISSSAILFTAVHWSPDFWALASVHFFSSSRVSATIASFVSYPLFFSCMAFRLLRKLSFVEFHCLLLNSIQFCLLDAYPFCSSSHTMGACVFSVCYTCSRAFISSFSFWPLVGVSGWGSWCRETEMLRDCAQTVGALSGSGKRMGSGFFFFFSFVFSLFFSTCSSCDFRQQRQGYEKNEATATETRDGSDGRVGRPGSMPILHLVLG